MGTFTATATTQSYTVENGANTQFNAVLLIKATAPTTASTNYVTAKQMDRPMDWPG
jgi:hypothetical protein